ncbi:MAG: hypothetical protein FWH34_04720, partial [Desulfovibrionaceae bacterium]|nr:hypothetical protein [Desulfovibrionaceae bacterium]
MLSSILPRILSLFDRERTSATYGVADRQYASWCTIDFANGAYQGAAFGLARLWAADALPAWCPSATALSVIESAFQGVAVIRRPNGSMEEAFPYESSFCVTALVAHDLLWAHKLLTEKTGRPYTKHLEILEPVIAFLLRHDERHGIISNHLATAAGALFLWHSLNGDVTAERKGHKLLGRIRRHASPEGWFREYG